MMPWKRWPMRAGESDGGDAFDHGTFDLVAGVFLEVALLRNGGELGIRIGGGLIVEHGVEQALGDEVGVAAVGSGGMGVVAGGEAGVAKGCGVVWQG